MQPDIIRDTNFYLLTPGRRVFACEQVATEASSRGMTDLAGRATAAAGADRELLDIQAAHRDTGAALHGSLARLNDIAVDRGTTSLDSHLAAQINLFGDRHARGLAAEQLRKALFPKGVAAITGQPYVQEHVEISNLLARAEAPALTEARAALPELTPMLAHLAELNQEYGEALNADDSLSNEELRQRNRDGQRRLAELIVLIYAYFLNNAPDDGSGLAALLEPIYRQNEAVRLSRRRRRTAPRDVDPDTGEETPDDGEDPDIPEDPDLPGDDDGEADDDDALI
ncbi:hypothetical protein [Haliangium sp.]|uniref:hypothetical protein n=1 Tax=Haliangium sp. TaxID=2663208 RepID=UPI003D1260BD